LIKLTTYPPSEGKEDSTPALPASVVIEEHISPQTIDSTSISSSSHSTKMDPHENGTILNRKVRFSDKVKVLRSISRLVSQSRESLRDHKHNKVHASEKKAGKQGQDGVRVANGGLPTVCDGDDKIETNGAVQIETAVEVVPVPLPTKTAKTRLFSSFRKKKNAS